MSAFMCSDAHFDLLATAYQRLVAPSCEVQLVGQLFAMTNALAICTLYRRHADMCDAVSDQAEAYCFKRWLGPIPPVFLSKQIACYNYQASEVHDWHNHGTFHLLEAMHAAGTPRYASVNSCEEEEYCWGVDEHHLITKNRPALSGHMA